MEMTKINLRFKNQDDLTIWVTPQQLDTLNLNRIPYTTKSWINHKVQTAIGVQTTNATYTPDQFIAMFFQQLRFAI